MMIPHLIPTLLLFQIACNLIAGGISLYVILTLRSLPIPSMTPITVVSIVGNGNTVATGHYLKAK